MLPREFLSQIADKYGLSPPETEVFLEKFSSNKSNVEIINQLNISDGTLRYRMGGVYTKFSISGKGPGKSENLRSFLTNEYLKYQPTVSPPPDILPANSPTSNTLEDELDELLQKAQFIRVSPDKLEQVIKALDSMPSVIQEKEVRERKASELVNLTLAEQIDLLANDINISRNLIHNFLNAGKVNDDIFVKICSHLNLDYQKYLDVWIIDEKLLKHALQAMDLVPSVMGKRQDIEREKSEMIKKTITYNDKNRNGNLPIIKELELSDKINLVSGYFSLNRSIVEDFFAKRRVNHNIFKKICSKLNLKDIDLVEVDSDIITKANLALDSLPSRIDEEKSYEFTEINLTEKISWLAKELNLPIEEIQNFFNGKPVKRQVFTNICLRLKLQKNTDIMLVDSALVKQAKEALPNLPSVIQEKNNREHKALDISRMELKDKIELLSRQILLTIDSIQKLFNSEPVITQDFIKICSCMNLEWREILDQDFLEVSVQVVPSIRAKYRNKIQEICGTMLVLYSSRLMEIDDLYVNVNILKQPPSYQWLDISKLPRVFDSNTNEFDRLSLGAISQPQVPGILAVKKHDKLMILGKPGAGKSTFLKYIAIHCNKGGSNSDRVPIFIELKKFAEHCSKSRNFSLFNYIAGEFKDYGIIELDIEKVLKYGRLLILLDGLDEVSKDDENEVIREIDNCCKQYYSNKFVITCRIAAQQYIFPGFTYVEVADFNQEQIEDFARKWFLAVAINSRQEGITKATQFIEKLAQQDNKPIRDIAVTPILLSLTCLVFENTTNFSLNRAKLYQEGIDILLRRWDEAKRIKRDEVYQKFSIHHKISLLSYIAFNTFDRSDYFFEQDRIIEIISNYLPKLPDATTNPTQLDLDSEAVLKAIEIQHGLLVERARQIYSFSHLTFQEYFTARAIVDSVDPGVWKYLAGYINDSRWREVFLLVTRMMNQSADELLKLMKQNLDLFIASHGKLCQFMTCLQQKALPDKPYKQAAIRAFYFARFFKLNPDFAFALDPKLERALGLNHCRNEYIDFIFPTDNGRPWHFSPEENKYLQQYYNGNKLLVECLNSGCQVTPEVRQEIENTLLLPIAEIEKLAV